MRVLIVDNDESRARTLARQLRLQGYLVDSATGYTQVEQMLETRAPLDAVISSWNLGHGHPSGVEVLKLARQRCPEARRVLVSGSMPTELDGEVGVFVQRPYRVGQLVSVLYTG